VGRPESEQARYGVKIPPCPSESRKRQAPPPCSFRAEHQRKVLFSFYLPAEASAQAGKKKSVARKIKNCKEYFAWWRALASGGGVERQFRSQPEADPPLAEK